METRPTLKSATYRQTSAWPVFGRQGSYSQEAIGPTVKLLLWDVEWCALKADGTSAGTWA